MPFSRLYLHIPWCLNKCGYCAFFSAPGTPSQRAETVRLSLREMELAARRYTAAGPLASVYLGGGTPSLLTPEQVSRLLNRSRDLWGYQTACEITLEANPGTVTPPSLAAFRQAGVNRLSLGIQTLDDRLLQALGRIHNGAQARNAYAAARAAGFTSISLDLICGLPGQSHSDWLLLLHEVIALAPEHLSVYSLTIEAGTPFYRRYPPGSKALPDDDQTAAMLEEADHLLTGAGYGHYEIANFALPGHHSRHNCGYWQRDGYLGVGPGVHSLLLQGWGRRCSNPADHRQWADLIGSGRLAQVAEPPLTAAEALSEQLFLGLRMADGVTPESCLQQFGPALWAPHGESIVELIATGLLERCGDRVALTRRGMLLANQVFLKFL